MKNKFFSLIFGLMVILISPVFTCSCVKQAQKETKEKTAIEAPSVVTDLQMYQLTDLAPNQKVRCASVFAFIQEDAAEGVTDTAEGTDVDESSEVNDLFGWQNILIAVLGIFSTLFATLWKRARNTISAIDEALKDGSIDKKEIALIVKAWKG